jgi:hypothetical protein
MNKIIRTTWILAGILSLASCASTPEAGTNPEPSANAPAPAKAKNLALGKSISANGHIYDFVQQSAVDGEVLSYFEGAANSFPNIVTLDLGEATEVSGQTLKLNPKRIWQSRTQTIELKVSDDGSTFTSAVPATEYVFDPEENTNSVTIVWQGKTRYLQLIGTSNSEATALQIAEWEVYGK